jgi:hypothetical protein
MSKTTAALLAVLLAVILLAGLISSFYTHLSPDMRDCRSFGAPLSWECIDQMNRTLQAEASLTH